MEHRSRSTALRRTIGERNIVRAECAVGQAGTAAGPGPLAVRLSRAHRRLVPTSLVAITGLLAVLGGLAPDALLELTELSGPSGNGALLAGRALLLELGVLLLLIAQRLDRGSRAAWRAATLGSAGVVLVEILRGRLSLVVALAAVSLLALLGTRGAFRLRLRDGRSRRLIVPAGLLTALLVYALVTYSRIGALHAEGLWSRLSQVALTGIGAPGGIDVEQDVVEAYAWSLRIGLAVVVLALIWALHRGSPGDAADTSTAMALAQRYGRASAAPLIALPDNARLPLCGGLALAGVAVRNGASISLGLPVAPFGLEAEALAEFVTDCETAGWTPTLLGLDERQRALAAAAGFASLRIGEEAFLDVAEFGTGGKRRANVRHSVTRARKDGVTVIRYDEATRTAQRDGQLAAISAAWLAGKGGPELGFTLGRFDLDRLHDQEVYAALTGEGTPEEQVVAFLTWLPYDGGDAAVLDLMRRGDPCPPGVMECLIVDSVADFARRGRHTASLGGVPLAATTERTDRTQQLLGWLYEHGGPVYAAKGLFRFKDKFAPRWEPMYLAYPRAADLPRIALAALRAFLPRGALRALRAHPPPRR
jgi:phosphatidylglycerol lysyltransferase